MHVRPATASDAAAVHDIYAPVVAGTAISFEDDPPTVEEIRRRIVNTLPTHPWLVCERDGDGGDGEGGEGIVGYAYAGPHRSRDAYRWSVDVSVYVAEDERGAGVGRTLYESLFALLVEQGFVTAYAGIAQPNETSVGLHESLGFEPVGVYESVGYKRGAWRDVGWWAKRLREPPAEPTPPVGVETVRVKVGEERFQELLATGHTS
ncbi:arsinothricin resistance N-acetyltransferase ArsN1 family B [Halobium salinum]|uniref:Arsinothricin resistance N-acetyltransferase ArsN1 family B n=1 Tax=Halobium salinum TaxID=1364940 RepID=A0ABD5P9D5_9EURY|nr:arsinothricin resistance N-acetyltransferase ArsN1 family B [Halobium salinum]